MTPILFTMWMYLSPVTISFWTLKETLSLSSTPSLMVKTLDLAASTFSVYQKEKRRRKVRRESTRREIAIGMRKKKKGIPLTLGVELKGSVLPALNLKVHLQDDNPPRI